MQRNRFSEYVFAKDLNARLREVASPRPSFRERWRADRFITFLALVTLLSAALILAPNHFFNPELRSVTLMLGVLGLWRFGWWFNHAIRAELYARGMWPDMRKAADRIWDAGWRPRRLHIQMTTYKENVAITRVVIGSIVDQVRREGIPTSLWIGTGHPYDEEVIREYLETHAHDTDIDVTFVRQNQPGKRMAIGLILRGMARYVTDPNDLVIFMDGDAAYGPDVLRKCLPLFAADPELQALTTNEEVICYGPNWVQSWLSMRFAQRRLAMQSHAFSEKVLTLTGRMSVFRAKHIISEKFVRTIEADHLDHWLWGRFRFLSGDDKSSWYHLLSHGAKMTYVPDAMVYTIEVIEGSGWTRMVENFRRWSGNMLRNGARAIALGPQTCGFFIWWCLIDQRLAIWTMMVGPALALMALTIDPIYFINVLIWVVASRMLLCSFLFRYAREPDLKWPFILYINQILNACVKIFMIFHLSKQKWANRGNQTSKSGTGRVAQMQNGIAKFQLYTAVATFLTIVAIMAGYLPMPV